MENREGNGDRFGLLSLTAISGINFKKAAELHVKLNVCNIDDLYDACKEGRLKELKGWSLSTENRIKSEIELNTLWVHGQCSAMRKKTNSRKDRRVGREFLLSLANEQAKENLI